MQVIELAPGQNAFAVGPRGRQLAGAGAGGDQHHVGFVGAGAAVRSGRINPVCCQTRGRVDQLASAGDHLDTRADQLGVDVGGLGGGQGLDPLMDLRQRDLGVVDVDVRLRPLQQTLVLEPFNVGKVA